MTDIRFDIIARDKASNTFNKVGGAADRTSSSMGKFVKVAGAAALGVAGVTAAAAVFAYKVGADYVGSLNKIQALTGANDKTMSAAAKTLESNSGLYAKMGQTTGDAAAGVVELTKAGLSLHDSLKAVNATMVLAKAGEMSVADASTLVANSLNTFHLKASGAAKIANELANAANISSADVADLAESFKYVAPLAAKAGMSVGDVSGILAELSNSGVKASQAGTSLRGMLLGLQAPTTAGANVLDDLGIKVYTAGGKMRDFGAVVDDLHNTLGKLSDADRNNALKAIFGKNAITGASILIQGGTKALNEYGKGIDKAGAAAELANAKSKGLAGTLAMIKAQTISSAQSLYRQLSPAVNDAILKLIGLKSVFEQQVIPRIREFANLIRSKMPALIAFAEKIQKNLEPALHNLEKAFKSTRPAVQDFARAVGTAGPQITHLTGHVVDLATKLNSKGSPAWARFIGLVGRQGIQVLASWVRTAGQVADGIDGLVSQVQFLARTFSQLGTGIAKATGTAAAFAATIPGKIKSAVGNLGSLLYGAGQAVIGGLISGVESKISSLTSALHHITSLIPIHKGPIDKDRKLLRPAGQAIMDGLIGGIEDRKLPLQTALDRVTGLISKVNDKVSNLKSTQAGFKGTFGQDSLFGVDLSHTTTDAAGNDTTTPETIADLLKYQKQQASHARSLARDVKAVTSKGLSKALVKQLQSQGASGAAALHALATGSPAQIAMLNRLNKQTSQSLQNAGMRAGNYVRGGSVAADIKRAERQEKILDRLEHHLKDLADSMKKGQTITVEIDGEAVVTAVTRRNHRKGVKTAGI